MTDTATPPSTTRYLTPREVCDLVPGLTTTNLKQLRFVGTGPQYLKPTPRIVLYRETDILEWLEASARRSTADGR